MAWFAQELESPDRNDLYLMQLTGVVAHLLAKGNTPWKPSDYALKAKQPENVEQRTSKSKAQSQKRWGMLPDTRGHKRGI